MTPIKFGVFLPFYAFTSKNAGEVYSQIKTVTLEAENLGYDSVWLDDHLMHGNWHILEAWTVLSALAASTRRIRLGVLVTCNAHRNPALLAKAATTLDVISNGRFELGIGAGCQQKEHNAYGFEFADAKTRVQQMAEALQVIVRLWTEPKASFSGKYYQLQEATCEPKPMQTPHPPITIGGAGEKHTLIVTAQYADRVDFGFLPTIDEYKRKLSVLERHCKTVGRNSAEIERMAWLSGQVLVTDTQRETQETVAKLKPADTPLAEYKLGNLVGTPEDCKTLIERFRECGATYFMLYFGDLPNTVSLRRFAQKVASNYS